MYVGGGSLTLLVNLLSTEFQENWFSGSRVVICRLLGVLTGDLEGGEHYYTGSAIVTGQAGHSPRALSCNGYTLPCFVHYYY